MIKAQKLYSTVLISDSMTGTVKGETFEDKTPEIKFKWLEHVKERDKLLYLTKNLVVRAGGTKENTKIHGHNEGEDRSGYMLQLSGGKQAQR